jgi:hypothetical protein
MKRLILLFGLTSQLTASTYAQGVVDQRALDLVEQLFNLPAIQLLMIVLLGLVIVMAVMAVAMVRIFDGNTRREDGQTKFEQSLVTVIADSNKNVADGNRNHAEANRIQASTAAALAELAHAQAATAAAQERAFNIHTANGQRIEQNSADMKALNRDFVDWSKLITDGMVGINLALNDLTNAVHDVEKNSPDIQAMIDSAIKPVLDRVNEVLALIKNPPPPTLPEAPKPEPGNILHVDAGPDLPDELPKASGQ